MEVVTVGAKAQWDSTKLGIRGVSGAALRDGKAIVTGSTGQPLVAERLSVADADSGKPRWTLATGEELMDGNGRSEVMAGEGNRENGLEGLAAKPFLVGSGERAAVVVTYAVMKDDGDYGVDEDVEGWGVAALSLDDGTVQWRKKLPAAGEPRLLSSDSGTVLVAARQSSSESSESSDSSDSAGGKVTTFALDATAKGKQLWKHRGGWVYELAGDIALGERAGDEEWSPGSGSENEGGSVFALDARTGEKKWDLARRYGESRLEAAVEGRAVVRVNKGAASETQGVVVDTRNGRKTDGLDEAYHHCATEGDSLLACVGLEEHQLVTIRAGKHNSPSSADFEALDGTDSLRVNAVDHGRIYVSGQKEENEGRTAGRRAAALDRAGNTRGDALPGPAVAASQKHVAVLAEPDKEGEQRLIMHRAAEGDEGPATPEPAGKSTVEPLSYEKKPLWGFRVGYGAAPDAGYASKDTGLEELHGVELAGDTLIYSGEHDELGYQVVGVDAATGKQRWEVNSEDGIGEGATIDEFGSQQLAGAHDQWLLLRYSKREESESGIAAVSVKDGKVKWRQPVSSGDGFVHLTGADDSAFVVGITESEGGKTSKERTRVYDLDSRRELWTKDGTDPVGLAGGTVLAVQRDLPYEDARSATADAVGFDARSGKRKWSLRDRYDRPGVLAADSDRVALVPHGGGTAVVDAADGTELGRTSAALHSCTGDGKPLLICGAGGSTRTGQRDGYPVTVELGKSEGKGKGGKSKATVRQLLDRIEYAQPHTLGPRFFATNSAVWEDEPKQYRAMDAQGRPIGPALPGAPVASTDRYVVLLDGPLSGIASGLPPGKPRLTVHRR
ncbi:PQQ-binding-like beta-propeller repeat protein [Streptomyces boninensis]|uniref:outer membrane protein assembly factor BamB family protein n=1 Tax=Streptomyces boninensis TaxID=2039455 RepID=UPI003B2260E4